MKEFGLPTLHHSFDKRCSQTVSCDPSFLQIFTTEVNIARPTITLLDGWEIHPGLKKRGFINKGNKEKTNKLQISLKAFFPPSFPLQLIISRPFRSIL